MEAIPPSTYREYVSLGKNGRKILYVRLHKAIHGCLSSALQLYRKLKGDLEVFNFLINPYYPFVAIKWVNCSQMSVTWHVENLKISHKEAGEVTKMITYL